MLIIKTIRGTNGSGVTLKPAESISDLRTLVPECDLVDVLVTKNNTTAVYQWHALSTEVDNDSSIIAPNSSIPGRWIATTLQGSTGPGTSSTFIETGLIATTFSAVDTTCKLDKSTIGGTVTLTNKTAIDVTMPDIIQLKTGNRIEFVNVGESICNILPSTGQKLQINGSTTYTSIIIGRGETATFEYGLNNTWLLVGGSVQLKYADSFYLYKSGWNTIQMLPSGLIIQTAVGADQGTFGWQRVTFPMAFPKAVHSCHVSTMVSMALPANGFAEYKLGDGNAISLTSVAVLRSNHDIGIGVTPIIYAVGE
jgi:hypothetical protein